MFLQLRSFPSLKFPEAFHTVAWNYFETTCSERKYEKLNKGAGGILIYFMFIS